MLRSPERPLARCCSCIQRSAISHRLSTSAAVLRGGCLPRWHPPHLIPVMTAAGPHITRSAYRHRSGEIVLIPTIFSAPPGQTASILTPPPQPGGSAKTPKLLTFVSAMTARYSKPWSTAGVIQGDEPFARYPFGVSVASETEFGGITIPSRFTAGWWRGADWQEAEGQFVRAHITGAPSGGSPPRSGAVQKDTQAADAPAWSRASARCARASLSGLADHLIGRGEHDLLIRRHGQNVRLCRSGYGLGRYSRSVVLCR